MISHEPVDGIPPNLPVYIIGARERACIRPLFQGSTKVPPNLSEYIIGASERACIRTLFQGYRRI